MDPVKKTPERVGEESKSEKKQKSKKHDEDKKEGEDTKQDECFIQRATEASKVFALNDEIYQESNQTPTK